ncbi:hypothetical protein O6H91_01G160500 [Diphasiastrum complanatum]|uniref:Uncharacterized protein n=1 Tax=Diphasiastrum complanatum TaxID=34168 RepID=A0ACC2EXW6_DIPCM|nr:hypothetical protein O6H91_01G160500 [Diphasiastrum complanatum]
MAGRAAAGSQLVELFEKVKHAAEKAAAVEEGRTNVEAVRCLDALKALKVFPVTTSLLMSTQVVGKQLRKLSKHPNEKIRSTVQDLVDDWKKLVATEVKSKAAVGSANLKKDDVQILKSVSVQSKGENVSMVVETKVKLNSQGAVNLGKRTEAFVNGPPKLKSLPKCNDATRDRIRELLLEALSKVCEEALDEDLKRAKVCDPLQVAVNIETTMFQKLGSSKGDKKLKYRSIMFNLKDANNPDLRRRVLLGDIKPDELMNMTAEDMASDERKLQNHTIKQKALFECERGMKQAASTDQFKCGKCGQRKCTYFQLQTRSADEPMTTFVTCVNCNNRWKFC